MVVCKIEILLMVAKIKISNMKLIQEAFMMKRYIGIKQLCKGKDIKDDILIIVIVKYNKS